MKLTWLTPYRHGNYRLLLAFAMLSLVVQTWCQDYLALSDSANLTESFVFDPKDYICSDSDCGDVLAAIAGIAKRMLSDKRVYHRRTSYWKKGDEDSGRSNDFDFYSSYLAGSGMNNRFGSSDSSNSYGSGSNKGYTDSTHDYNTGSGSTYGSDLSIYNVKNRAPYVQSKYGANIMASASGYDEGGYGGSGGYSSGGSSYGGGGGYGDCCGKKDSLLPLLVVGSLGLLAFYLYLRTTTTAAGRRLNDLDDVEEDVYLDGPTWLSLVHELWEQDGVVEDPSCAQHTICRMNNMAMSAPGQAGWAVSLSSLPLSYLLHRRHDGGFSVYMDAALMGRSGANCTQLYNNCARLH